MIHPQNRFDDHSFKGYAKSIFVLPFELGVEHLKLVFGKDQVISNLAQRKLGIEGPTPLSFKEKSYHVIVGISECIPVLGTIIALAELFFQKKHSDQTQLVTAKHPFAPHQYFWHLNLALLRNAYTAATGAKKSLINFLAANYLAKIAPKHAYLIKSENNSEPDHQSSPIEEYRYHRECIEQRLFYGKKLNDKLAYGEKSLFILTDTLELDHLFPLKFTVIDQKKPENTWAEIIKKTCLEHISAHASTPWTQPLIQSLLFDVSGLIDGIQTDLSPEKESAFVRDFEDLKKRFEAQVLLAIEQLIIERPYLDSQRSKIQQFLNKNITCISRVQIDEARGIKLLPMGSRSSKDAQFHSPLTNFVITAGLSIGAVNLRRTADDVFKQIPDVDYGVSKPFAAPYYETKEAFTSKRLFQRLSCLFGSRPVPQETGTFRDFSSIAEELIPDETRTRGRTAVAVSYGINLDELAKRAAFIETKPHIKVLGKATIELLDGLFKEIDEEKWAQIQEDPILAQIFQTSLFLVQEHLANSESYAISGNFNKFAEKIELVHAELATLLELAKPFERTAFNDIYKEKILGRSVPVKLQDCLTAGIGKTGVNIFAGVAAAAKKEGAPLRSIHSNGSYFEAAVFTSGEFDSFIANPSMPKINLYLGQFNPNVDVGSTLTEYKRRDIVADVRKLIAEDRVEDSFTVAVDITIEEFYSENSRQLLDAFQKEIREGTINFVFFSSGQKFYTLGMDNYYGGYFYAVNNQDSKWAKFNSLANHPVHEIDDLSAQWFCLATKYASDSLDSYRKLIFENSRKILDSIPDNLQPEYCPGQIIRVNRASADMTACFVDVKVIASPYPQWIISKTIEKPFHKRMAKEGILTYSRGSFGFYHQNFSTFGFLDSRARTIRLNPGINPEENAPIQAFFRSLANQRPHERFLSLFE